jgi:hypothetical protein
VSPAAPVDFSTVDYIWVSHEHPDHFNFPTLKGIPDHEKKRIRILYQRHASPRIVEAFKELGFRNVTELPLYRWVKLTPDLEVLCGSVGVMDSFLALRNGDECVLNLNDCVLNEAQRHYVKRLVGKVSLLFIQFSFANWVGNDHDQLGDANRKRRDLEKSIAIFNPELTIPFASFVYFCNEENCRQNAWMNTPETIARLGLKGVQFMYPGDEWDSKLRTFQSDAAVERYMKDYAVTKIDPRPQAVEVSRISEAVEKCFSQSRKKWVHRLFTRKIPPLTIYLHDINKVLLANPSEGSHSIVEATPELADNARFVMCSQAAWFLFAFPWGAGTTAVSAMYLDRQYSASGTHPFFKWQGRLSTEVLELRGLRTGWRTARFWWAKRWEVLYRFRGGPAADDLS